MSGTFSKEQLQQQLEGPGSFKQREKDIDTQYPTKDFKGNDFTFEHESDEKRLARARTYAMRYFLLHNLYDDVNDTLAPFRSKADSEGVEEEVNNTRKFRNRVRNRRSDHLATLKDIPGVKEIVEAQMLSLANAMPETQDALLLNAWTFVSHNL